MLKKLLLSLLFASVSLSAQAQEPINLATVKKSVISYHDSGEYDRDIAKIIEKAKASLQQKLQDTKLSRKKLAIILDIDETALSNYPDMKKMDFGGTLKTFTEAADRGEDPVIKPTLKLYNFAKANHVAVFFITGRQEFERQATIKNLQKAGYQNWDGLILRSEAYQHTPASAYKSAMRTSLAAQGYKIILNIGDQESDLKGAYHGETFKLPNPFYYIA